MSDLVIRITKCLFRRYIEKVTMFRGVTLQLQVRLVNYHAFNYCDVIISFPNRFPPP